MGSRAERGRRSLAERVVRLDELRCVRLSDQPSAYQSERFEGLGSRPLQLTRVPDVLYIPDLRLQVIGDRLVPSEALQHEWYLDFEIARAFQGAAARFSEPFACDRRADEVCVLANFYSRNFLHFVTEELAKVTVLEEAGYTGRYLIAGLPAFAGEALSMLGLAPERIIETIAGPTLFAAAWYVTPINPYQAMDFPDVYLALRERLLAAAAPNSQNGGERLWLERRTGVNNHSREIVNRAEVDALLNRFGFARIDMGAMPLAEQVAVARDTLVLAGPHDAGNVHALFMPAGSDVIECYSPLYINPAVQELCLLMRHRYSMLVYELAFHGYPWGDRLMVNISHLELALRALDAAPHAQRPVGDRRRLDPTSEGGAQEDAPHSVRNGTAVDELVARYRQEISEWGHLPAAMRLKQELVRRIGVLGAHAVAREALEVPGLDSLHWRPTAEIRQAAERDALVFRPLWPGGERFTLSPPATVGVNNNQALVGTSRAGFLACLSDVQVRGRSGILLVGGEALLDIEAWEAGTFEDNPEYDPGILGQTRAGLWTMEPLEPELEVNAAFLLCGAHTIDFGHWITEYLPRYAMARLAGLPDVPVLIDERMPPTHRESLELLLPADAEIIVVPHLAVVRVHQLWYAPNSMYMGFYPVQMDDAYWSLVATHAERFARLVTQLEQYLCAGAGLRGDPAGGGPGGRRLFLARRPNQKKKLLNHVAVEEAVAGHGFEVIYAQDMTFQDQLRAIRDATHIVGPDGSALFLALFARPGARLAVLNPPYTLPLVDVAAMLRARGIETTIVTGPAVPGADEFSPFWDSYQIELDGLGAFLREWLR